jgi:hypothetical protein
MKNLTISDDVFWCYKHINAIDIKDKVIQLSEIDKCILFLICVDFYTERNDYLLKNLKPIDSLASEILEVIEEKSINPSLIIQKLQELIGDSLLNLPKIYLKDGGKLPRPTTELEAIQIRRNFNLDRIFE